MELTLDCRTVADRKHLHALLAEGFAFPEWYGGNLDAMFDCLTELHEPAELRVLYPEALGATLGNYADIWLRALREAAEENPHLTISVAGEDTLD